MPARDSMPHSTVCATPSPPAACQFVSTSTVRRSIARRNWRGLPPPLGTLSVHSRPNHPEGRSKIERFFRTVREQFLANLDPKHPLSVEEVNDRLGGYYWVPDGIVVTGARTSASTAELTAASATASSALLAENGADALSTTTAP